VLIITLDKRGETYDRIRKVCLAITIEYVQPKNILHAYIKLLVPKLINTWVEKRLVKSLHNQIRVNTNADDFIANIVTDKQETHKLGWE